jgi:hypothetical protein
MCGNRRWSATSSTSAELARFIAAEPQFDKRWRPAVEFLKEYHRER